MLGEVAVGELRNHGADVLDRVERGESLIVTRGGRPVAELRPLQRNPLDSVTLLTRWRALPAVDGATLRQDIDAVLDSAV